MKKKVYVSIECVFFEGSIDLENKCPWLCSSCMAPPPLLSRLLDLKGEVTVMVRVILLVFLFFFFCCRENYERVKHQSVD